MKPAVLLALFALVFTAEPAAARNIVIFVADGLRYGSVTPQEAPVMSRLKREGVDFADSHALYPTLTTVNASAIATGHYIGDTGDFGNVIYTGHPMLSDHGSPVPFLENDVILDEMNERFGGNYLGETSLIEAARAAGYETAVLGKEGPSRIQDLGAARNGSLGVLLDDATGHDGGFALPPGYAGAMRAAFVPLAAPATTAPDFAQETFLIKAATRVVLPKFKASGKPFVLIFWSRDPDITQHNATDSLGELSPGINAPTAAAAVRNADTMLGELVDALKRLGLDGDTDLFVTADHGFATIAGASATSPAAHLADPDVPLSDLPFGFLAIDLASGLGLPLYDPNQAGAPVDYGGGARPSAGAGIIGRDPARPDIVVVPNGGSDLIYLPQKDAGQTARDVVDLLMRQDYVSGIFVNDALGPIAGTLPMSEIGLIGSARTPPPAIYVNFRSFSVGCGDPLMCAVEIADTPLRTGQGMHGGFSRAETRNFMAASGPDFKTGFVDTAPVGNADIAPTLARLIGVTLPANGALKGRVASEALRGGAPVEASRRVIRSEPGAGGQRTYLDVQTVGGTRYFDAGGFEDRTLGLATR